MLPKFDRSTPIVDFGANSWPLGWGKYRWILWPTLAYKVLLPAQSNPAFNVFQRAVLDLCRARVRLPNEIAVRLALPEDLMTFILDQLRSIDMLDDRGNPTERALRLLAEDDHPIDAEDAGYVFIDGHTHKLWPRIHRGSLPVCNADIDEGSIAQFRRGDVGKPVPVKAKILWPNTKGVRLTEPPAAFDILKAARHHQRRARAFARESSRAIKVEGDFPRNIKSVRLVGTAPESIFVAACIFLPDDARQTSWLVTDPCGLGISHVLRDPIDAKAKMGNLEVIGLLHGLMGEAWRVDEGDFAYYLAEANQAAVNRVARHLGDGAKLLPLEAIESLAHAEEKLAQARASDRTKRVEDFFASAFAAVESVFGWMISLYPDPRILTALDPDAFDNIRLLRAIADGLGFTTSEHTQHLFCVSRGAVKSAVLHGNRTLVRRLAACLLAAKTNPNHPLASLAVRYPSALEFLARFSKLRNEASHDSESLPALEIALDERNHLYEFLRPLVGSSSTSTVSPDQPESSWGEDLVLKLRAQAEQALRSYESIDEYPELRARLMDMQQAAIVVKLLARAREASPESLGLRLADVARAAAIVVEALLGEIERDTPSNVAAVECLSDDREKNAMHLADVAASLHFDLDEHGKLPASLTHARPDRIQRAARGLPETLSARVIAQLFSAEHEIRHPFHHIAQTRSAFLLDIGTVVAMRGHGDRVDIDVSQVEGLEGLVRNAVRAVLDALD